MSDKTLTKLESGRRELQTEPGKRTKVVPPSDVIENEDGITVCADLPGVTRDGLSVRVDGDTLVIEGEANLKVPENMESLHADLRSLRYQRIFTLSRELDSSNIDAELKNGVLRVKIPKREESKPRRIEVKVA